MNEQHALNEIGRIDRKVRARSRWYGWAWLIIAIDTFVFLMVDPPGPSGNDDLSLVAALVFGLIAAVLWFVESRRAVVGRAAAKLYEPISWGYVGLMVFVTLLHVLVLPDGYTAWLVLVALLPTIPCLFGAWKVLRS